MKIRSGALRIGVISFLTIMAVWITAYYHGYPRIGVDDANIFFSYADNLSGGHGFVYNIGGERVEGFTSLLYVLLCALAFYIGLDEQSLLFFSVALLIGVQLILTGIIKRESLARGTVSWPYEALCVLLILSSPSYVTWMSITLMDTCMWGAFLALGAFFVLYPPTGIPGTIAAAMTFSLMPLVRPEGMMLSPALIVFLGLRLLADGGWAQIIRAAAHYLLPFAGTLLGLTVFRILYFGYPFPNTYYAKVSPLFVYNLQMGSKYLFQYLFSSPIVFFAVLITAVWVTRRIATIVKEVLHLDPSRTRGRLLELDSEDLLSAIALILILIPVITGGDHFLMFRFFQPVYPILCLVVILSAQRTGVLEYLFEKGLMKRVFAVVLVVVFLIPFCLYWLYAHAHDTSWSSIRQKSPIGHEFRIATKGADIGRRLEKLFLGRSPLPSFGVIAAGGIKRTYPGEVVDLMGLNNTLMAHTKGDRKGIKNHSGFEPAGFYALLPDIVFAAPPQSPEETGREDKRLKGVFREARFQALYSYGTVESRKPGTRDALMAFFRKEFLHDLVRSGGWEYIEDENWSKNWIQSRR